MAVSILHRVSGDGLAIVGAGTGASVSSGAGVSGEAGVGGASGGAETLAVELCSALVKRCLTKGA